MPLYLSSIPWFLRWGHRIDLISRHFHVSFAYSRLQRATMDHQTLQAFSCLGFEFHKTPYQYNCLVIFFAKQTLEEPQKFANAPSIAFAEGVEWWHRDRWETTDMGWPTVPLALRDSLCSGQTPWRKEVLIVAFLGETRMWMDRSLWVIEFFGFYSFPTESAESTAKRNSKSVSLLVIAYWIHTILVHILDIPYLHETQHRAHTSTSLSSTKRMNQ